MDLAAAFGEIGLAFSAVLGGPFHPARIIEITETEYDDGGSIISAGGVAYRACQCQIDSATEAMRQQGGFVDGDLRFIILSATLDGSLGTDARIEVLEGPFTGIWSVEAIERDPVAARWVGRGRRG